MGDIIRKRKGGKDLGWYIRWVDSDGKRKQRASHQPTYALAKRMLLEIEARVARGQAGMVEREETPKLTVAELCDKWLAEFASPRIKDLPRYRSAVGLASSRSDRPRSRGICAISRNYDSTDGSPAIARST